MRLVQNRLLRLFRLVYRMIIRIRTRDEEPKPPLSGYAADRPTRAFGYSCAIIVIELKKNSFFIGRLLVRVK